MKQLFILFLLYFSVQAAAQNLVLNPSFENYHDCPATLARVLLPSSTIISVENWSKPHSGTSDYYNTCSGPGSDVYIPDNIFGHQYARTGNAYTGFVVLMDFEFILYDYTEYLQGKLTTPLIAGHKYFCNYWVSLPNKGVSYITATDQLGAYFSDSLFELPMDYGPMDYLTPQISSPIGVTYSDTLNWEEVSGIFTATGGEQYMLIGNFASEDLITVDTVLSLEPFEQFSFSYYYCDDICVLDIDLPSVHTFTDTSLCKSPSLELSGRDSSTSFIWDDGSIGKTRTINTAGTYWVTSINTNMCMAYRDSFQVRAGSMPIPLNLGNDTIICSQQSLMLYAADSRLTNYLWSTSDTTSFLKVEESGVYSVVASGDCVIAVDTITVGTFSPPKVHLPADMNICEGTAISLKSSEQSSHYLWNTGSSDCCISPTESGIYTLTVKNECGETSTDQIVVNFAKCDYCIVAPNAFSPNGDGLNDNFEVNVNCPMKNYRLSIFNRWGQLVFSTVKYDKYWDGLVNGKPADLGVYFYYIEATPAIEGLDKIVKKGDVTLVR